MSPVRPQGPDPRASVDALRDALHVVLVEQLVRQLARLHRGVIEHGAVTALDRILHDQLGRTHGVVERVKAVGNFKPIGVPIAIGIGGERIGAEGFFGTIGEAVMIGVYSAVSIARARGARTSPDVAE